MPTDGIPPARRRYTPRQTCRCVAFEILVHTVDARLIPPNLVWSYADLYAEITSLDYQWDIADESLTRQAGHRWIKEGNQLAALVPSVIIPPEYNVLLNPTHHQYDEITWSDPQPFPWDRRIIAIVRGSVAR